MSQPRDPSEIEDVLAAIRRLVREEHAPAPSATPPDSPGKLVLTPALRVSGAGPARGDTPEARAGGDSDAEDVLFLHRPVWTPDDPPGERPRDDDAGLEAKIAELEALVGAECTADAPPDASDAGRAGPEPTAGPDARTEAAPTSGAIDRTASGQARADGRLDEAALRGMVREIVREELQGAAGEPIARRLQDLVRAEIRRAFTAQDKR